MATQSVIAGSYSLPLDTIGVVKLSGLEMSLHLINEALHNRTNPVLSDATIL